MKNINKKIFKNSVEQQILNTVQDYLNKKKISFKAIKLKKIDIGLMSKAKDGGSFKISVLISKHKKINLFAKKNTQISRWIISKRKLLKQTHPFDHNFDINKLLFDSGFKIPKPLFIDKKTRIIITEFIDGKKLSHAIKENTHKTLQIIRKMGEEIGKLHKNNYIHKDLHHEHFFINLTKEDFVIIDNEKVTNTNQLCDFVNDLNRFSLMNSFIFSTKYSIPIWDNFTKGYLKTGPNNANKIISLCYYPKKQKFRRKFWFKLMENINYTLCKISRGKLYLINRFKKEESIKTQIYLMKLYNLPE